VLFINVRWEEKAPEKVGVKGFKDPSNRAIVDTCRRQPEGSVFLIYLKRLKSSRRLYIKLEARKVKTV
jgi:hypothetical protein